MAVALSGSGQYFTNASASVVTAPPFTIACWFKSTDMATRQSLVCLGNVSNTTQSFALEIDGSVAGKPVVCTAQQTSYSDAVSSTGYSSGVWAHAAGVWTDGTNRAAFINGGSKGTVAFARTPGTPFQTRIGARINSGAASNLITGSIAEVGIWNVALSDNEVLRLAKGFSPLRVRPASLKMYVPLITTTSPSPDFTVGQRTFTATGSPTLVNPPPGIAPRWGYEDGYGTGGNTPNAGFNSFGPTSGPTAGGTAVTMDFLHTVGTIKSVSFGGTLGTGLTNLFGTLWQVTTPAHASAVVPVSINGDRGGSILTQTFNFTDSTGGAGARMLTGMGS